MKGARHNIVSNVGNTTVSGVSQVSAETGEEWHSLSVHVSRYTE